MFNRKKETETIVMNAGLEEILNDLATRVSILEDEKDSIKSKFELIKGKGKIFKLENDYAFCCGIARFFNTLNGVEVEEEISEDSKTATVEIFSTKYILTLEKIDYSEKELYKITEVEEVK